MSKQLNFVADAEPWCRYTLDDGSVVRIRVMLVRCTRDELNGDGSPKYELQLQQIVDVTPSDLAVQSAKEESK